MSAANRRRGADAERAVVNYLRQWWPDARRYLAGDGRQPGDIDAIPGVCIEVKDRAVSAWPTWREQAFTEAGPARIPIVVRRVRGVRHVDAWDAQIPTHHLWNLMHGNPLSFVAPSIDCKRTEMPWNPAPFGELIDLLRRSS